MFVLCHNLVFVLLPFDVLGRMWNSIVSVPGMRTVAGSILTSGKTFFRWDLVVRNILRPFSPFRWFKNGSYQLLGKEWALSTGKLPRRTAQEQCGLVNWPSPRWPKMCRRAVKRQHNKPTKTWSSAFILEPALIWQILSLYGLYKGIGYCRRVNNPGLTLTSGS